MQKAKYGVLILKKDQDHIQVLETDNFEEADKLWEELTTQWTTCLHEQTPFKVRKPIITAFDPGLIYEVTLRPVVETSTNPNNPYQEKAQREGFSAALKGNLLDGGYI